MVSPFLKNRVLKTATSINGDTRRGGDATGVEEFEGVGEGVG